MSESSNKSTNSCTSDEGAVLPASNSPEDSHNHITMPSSSSSSDNIIENATSPTDSSLSPDETKQCNAETAIEKPVVQRKSGSDTSKDAVNNVVDETVLRSEEVKILGEENTGNEASSISYVVSNESDEEESSRVHDENIKNINLQMYRDNIIEGSDNSDSSDSDSSSTVSDDNDDDSDNDSSGEGNDVALNKIVKSMRTRGELGLEDLPPIEDLEISVDENKCKEIGTVYCIVDSQVVVQSFPNTPPLNLDTVLFLDRGQRPLGRIFDVLGNVREPLYAVRFNSREHIKEKNITKDQTVYCAPQTEYTSYVNTSELLRNKGSDASWHHNNEPPVTCLDFSDDEEEARYKRTTVPLGSKRENQTDNELFVKKMNQRNLELTAKRKKEDEAKQKRVPLARRMISNGKSSVEMVNLTSQSFTQFTDNYKLKARSFANSDQASASRLVNFHHNSSNVLANKFEPAARSVNFLVGAYSSPSNFTFPPQHFLCSSPRQLPNVAPSAQNYLTMYSRPSMHSPTAMPPPPPPPPPPAFSSFSSANIPTMSPAFPSQPTMHPALPPSMHGPMPPQFSTFNPLPTPPLPTSLPQPNFFPCTDAPPVHQPTFIPLNVRPGISAASFHPQFVLPPPPPPPPLPSIQQHHPHQRDMAIPRPDRRNPQCSHQASASFYPHSPFNS